MKTKEELKKSIDKLMNLQADIMIDIYKLKEELIKSIKTRKNDVKEHKEHDKPHGKHSD